MKTCNDGGGPVPRHLDEEELLSYMDGELLREEQEKALAHLESCWNCRSRLLAVQNSIENFLRVRKQIVPSEIPPASPALMQFRQRLERHTAVPVSLRTQFRLRFPSWRRLMLGLSLLPRYKKSALATALALTLVVAALLDPFNWTTASADELLARAYFYELRNELPISKVVRSKVRIDRVDLVSKLEKNLGQIETIEDNLSSAVYLAADTAASASHKARLLSRDKLYTANLFTNELPPPLISYFEAQTWFPQVSASAYRRLIGGRGLAGHERAFVRRHGDSYEVHHSFAAAHASGITETVLFLNPNSYAAQRISIFSVEHDEQAEYRLTRTSFQSVERTAELARLFEAAKAEPAVTHSRESSSKATENEPGAKETAISPTPVTASVGIEIETLALLAQARADLGEQVSVERTPEGALRIEGIVETENRKQELKRALSPVLGSPAVRFEIETVEEALRRTRPAAVPPPVVEQRATTASALAVEEELRRYLSGRGRFTAEQLDGEVQRLARRTVNASFGIRQHVQAMKRLVERFAPEQWSSFDEAARARLLSLIESHASAVREQGQTLRQSLQSIFNRSESQPVNSGVNEIAGVSDLIRAINQLVELSATSDRAIQTAFTLSTEGAHVQTIKTPTFWSALTGLELAAGRIQTGVASLPK